MKLNNNTTLKGVKNYLKTKNSNRSEQHDKNRQLPVEQSIRRNQIL